MRCLILYKTLLKTSLLLIICELIFRIFIRFGEILIKSAAKNRIAFR